MNIISNGSHFAGSGPDSAEDLLRVLSTDTLDPRFEKYGNFVFDDGQRVWGNFLSVSHVFEIEGTKEELEPIVAAIRANQNTGAYRVAKIRMAKR